MKIKHSDGPHGSTLTLIGAIDESIADTMAPLVVQLRGPEVHLHCGKVASLNSHGASRLFSVLTQLRARFAVRFVDCPLVVANYANAVRRFILPEELVSIEVPFRCAVCHVERLMFIAAETIRDNAMRAPAPQCDGCGRAMELDADADDYFACLRL